MKASLISQGVYEFMYERILIVSMLSVDTIIC